MERLLTFLPDILILATIAIVGLIIREVVNRMIGRDNLNSLSWTVNFFSKKRKSAFLIALLNVLIGTAIFALVFLTPIIIAFGNLSQESWLWIFTASISFGAYESFFTSPIKTSDLLKARIHGKHLPDSIEQAKKIMVNMLTRQQFVQIQGLKALMGMLLVLTASYFGILYQSILIGVALGYVATLGIGFVIGICLCVCNYIKPHILDRSHF